MEKDYTQNKLERGLMFAIVYISSINIGISNIFPSPVGNKFYYCGMRFDLHIVQFCSRIIPFVTLLVLFTSPHKRNKRIVRVFEDAMISGS